MKEKTIDYILRATWQAVSRMYNEEASKFDGSMAIGFALLSIDKEEGSPSTAISSRMGMEATSLTRTLKTLEEKGLIVKTRCEDDKRNQHIVLTDEGKKLYPSIKQIVLQTANEMLEGIDENQQKQLEELLLKMKKNLEGKDE